MLVFQSRISHQRARYDFTRCAQIAIEGGGIPDKAGRPISGGITKIRYHSGMAANDAEETWTDNISARLGRVTDAALGPEDSRARRGILCMCGSKEPETPGKNDPGKK
jgi:hypothetical protein